MRCIGDADALRAEGQTVMFVAVDGRGAGLVARADPIVGTGGVAGIGIDFTETVTERIPGVRRHGRPIRVHAL